MKIRDVSGRWDSKVNRAENEVRRADIGQPDFYDKFAAAENKSWDERITNLLDRISEQGEKLGKRADIGELKTYKRLISEFLEETVHRSHKFSKENFLDRRGRHRVYAVVKKVDESLEELTKEVLKEEKDHLRILKMLDDIRGLLLDITM